MSAPILDSFSAVPGVSSSERIKEVVEERTDESGRLVRVTRKIRMRLVTEKVCPQVAARADWKKFGDAAGDGAGPNVSSTIIGEPVFLRLSMSKDHDQEPAKATVVAAKNIVCRYCQGAHWSAKCPYKSTFAEDAKEAAAGADDKEANKPLKYIPPSLRRSAEAGAAGDMLGTTTTTYRDNPHTIRISNLSEVVTEMDIRDLVGCLAIPARVYVPKDYRTGLCRGAAYVSFHMAEDVQRVIQKLHGHPYGNMILHVEPAKPQEQ